MSTLDVKTTVLERFIKIANKFPDRSAATWLDGNNWQSINYKDLKSRAASVAAALSESGVTNGDAVIIPSLRTPNLFSNLLGILWAGGHYVFIDPNYPAERQKFICNEVDAQFGITEPGTSQLDHLKLHWLKAPLSNSSAKTPTIPKDTDLPAYVMFTSGSTGPPKGVIIPHRGITRLVVDTDYIHFSENEAFLQHSSLSFDASTLEIWGPLLNGGTCVLHTENDVVTPKALQSSIEAQNVSTLWLTSSMFNTLISEYPEVLKSIKQLLTGGETLSVPHIEKGLSLLLDTQFFNGYGPTENTTFSTVYSIPAKLPEGTTRIPIGFPIAGTRCELFDENLQPLTEKDTPGELIVFGEGLALEYSNLPELTAEKFIKLTCADGQERKGYRTGDIVIKRNDGSYDFIERNDTQVKIDGHRIEPGEIEHYLNGLGSIDEARVVVRVGPNGQKRLAAYVVGEADFLGQDLRAQMKDSFPQYMIPHFIVPMSDLPKNKNGKLDEKQLPDPFTDHEVRHFAHNEVAACWEEVLGRKVPLDVNFTDAGGTSLEALLLTKHLESKTGKNLSATFVFEFPTISLQVDHFKQEVEIPTASSTAPRNKDKSCEFAIVGMACRFPGAKNLQEFWSNLLEAKETISFFSDEELSSEIDPLERKHSAYIKAKGIIEDCDKFDARFFGISPIEAEIMDPQQRIMLELSWHALEDAGIPPGDKKYRTGVFAGMNWARYYQQYVLPNKDLIHKFGKLNSALANESDLLSTRISYKLNLKGPSINLFTACSTGLVAVAQACEAIEQGQCEQALAGGISISTPIKSGYMYQEGSMLSKDGHCRPFDADAAGTTFNDGAGVITLKRLDLAERDGDRIYAVIKGFAVNNDGEQKASFTAPSVNGQVEVYNSAITKAGIDPSSVGFIEAHGTATPLGDPIEVLSLNKSYAANGNSDKACALGSVKSNIGHAIHAAGIASLIKATLAVQNNAIPPTLFFKTPNPKLELDKTPFFVNDKIASWPLPSPRRSAVSSLGVGGTNAHVILEEYSSVPSCKKQKETTGNSQNATRSILLSAKSDTSLERQIESYHHYFQHNQDVLCITDAAYTSLTGRQHFAHRAAVSGSSPEEITQKLNQSGTYSSGKAFSCSESKIGFMFSGQGSQRVAMGKWLYQNDQDYKKSFDLGCSVILEQEGFDLKAILFSNPDDSDNVAAVNQTRVTQPALFLLEYGIAQYLIKRGCSPDFLIGHSIGEFTAAALAGIFTFEDAIALVAKRGTLMQSMPPGKMLVVKASRDSLEDYIDSDISLAAVNAPKLSVLAGPEEKILDVEKDLAGKKIASTVLQTSHAFHSSMMEPILAEFTSFVGSIAKESPKIPVISTKTGERLTDEEAVSLSYWASQLRQPVLFSRAITTATSTESNCSTALVEIGPGTTLASLVNYHPNLENVLAIPSLPSCGFSEQTEQDLEDCRNNLWVKGFSIDRLSSFAGIDAKKISLPGYAFSPDSYWLQPPEQESAAGQTLTLATLQMPLKTQTQEIEMNPEQHLDRIKQDLKSLFEDVTGYDLNDMEDETHFSEVGLDSLLLTQIATAIDRKFDVGITFRHLVEDFTCLAELALHIADKVPVETPAVSSPAIPNPPKSGGIPHQQLAANTSIAATTGNPLQDLINAQLQIMQMQLQAFSSVSSGQPTAMQSGAIQAGAANSDLEKGKTAEGESKPKEKTQHARGTRITKEALGTNLTEAQKSWIDDLNEKFQKKFSGSKAYTQKHRGKLADPRSVSGFNPEWKETIFPIVTEKSKGSKLWDVDGNELIDTANGFGPIFFGHSPDFINQAIKDQLDKGIETGPQSPIAGEVAELFCELTGNERCSFASTGSEAVLGALRLARTVTGRNKVVMFEGAYHGIFDEVINRPGRDHQALPAAPGIPKESTENMLVLPWGEQESLDIIKEMGNELAAVLVESVQSRKPEFHNPEYIKALRAVTASADTALILDEVVTGFRVHPGGIQRRFDIDADLATYGKVVGGGLPIGIIGGKAKFMDALDGGYWQYGDSSIPECGVTFFAGTFVRHPLSLVAAKAVLEKIKSSGMSLYDDLESKTSEMAKDAKSFIAEMETEVKFEEFASLFYISVPTMAYWGHLLFQMMTHDGIHIQQYRPNFLTTEHSSTDIQKILTAFKKSLAELIVHGLIEGNEVAAKKYLTSNKSIPVGARLGKNAQGEPAYFIEDPDNKGQFIEMGKP